METTILIPPQDTKHSRRMRGLVMFSIGSIRLGAPYEGIWHSVVPHRRDGPAEEIEPDSIRRSNSMCLGGASGTPS
jgi:hypothetical protein